jgi:predicted MFS family arabinose efflux permease
VALAGWLVRRTGRLAARGGHPLVDPAAFRGRAVRSGLLGQALLFCGMASYFLVLAVYLQVGHGLGPLASGLVFTVLAVAYMVGTRRAARLTARLGRWALPAAALVFTAGHLLVLVAVASTGLHGSVLWLTPGLAVSGLGMGVCLSSLVGSVMTGVEPTYAVVVSGALSTVQQLGNALGVALVGLVFYGAGHVGIDVAFERSLVCLAGATLLLAVVTGSGARGGSREA